MSLLADIRLSQPRRSCGSSEFLMKSNLIEKLLLPSASGLHRGHTQQHSAALQACGRLHRAANKGYVHVCALGNEDTELSFSASIQSIQFLDHCWTFLEPKAMNLYLCNNLNFGFVHMIYFCMENMSIFPDAKVGKAQSRLKS